MMTTEAPVISVMTVNPITITVDTTLARIRELLELNRIRYLPVLGAQNMLVGVVSVADLAIYDRLEVEKALGPDIISTRELTATELMTSEIIGLAPDDTIGLAADLFLSRALHAAPVLDDGELVGIVTCHHLIQQIFADVLPLKGARVA